MSGRIRELPVIGRILRIAASVIHGPQRFDRLYDAARQAEERMTGLEEQMTGLRQREAESQERQDSLRRALARMEGEELPRRVSLLEAARTDMPRQVRDGILADGAYLEELNLRLSIHPTLWGPAERLRISPLASVFTCFFNTNSGTISIGDYTFAGSGVSILAGSHDPRLTGFLRRDAEMRDECDIQIGSGVWLASGCTVLGPCRIDDHAVIAAGAVVTPGTHVPRATMYGGVPAKKICDLATVDAEEVNHPAILEALRRHDGALFVSGWSPKSEGLPVLGHWLTGEGTVLVSGRTWRLMYLLRGADRCTLTVTGPGGEIRIPLEAASGEQRVELPCAEGQVEKVIFSLGEEGVSLLMALLPPEEGNEK
ncbi:MAG: hypothetical protein IKE24_07085 [Clostridia bacterium]|nr:hypothetical protein [Clostridia bacterium]